VAVVRTPLLLLALPLALAGCEGDLPADVEPPPFCDAGRTVGLYDPSPEAGLTTFPDDHWTREDGSTRTGLRVDWRADEGTLDAYPPQWQQLALELETLDGFGTTAGIVFRFAGVLDPASVTQDSVALVALEESGPVAHTVDIEVFAFPNTVILRPHVPLAPGVRVAAALLDVTGDDGQCVVPSASLQDLLTPGSEAPMAARFAEGLDLLGAAPEDVAAMTVFTTQSTVWQALDVAEDVADRDVALTGPMDCSELDDGRWRCEGALEVGDYRGADGVVPSPFTAEPQSTYALPVSVWLPGPLADGPYPVAVAGHGLAGGRNEGNQWSREGLAPIGFAVVSVDAVDHGDHPLRVTEGSMLTRILGFFGIGSAPYVVQGLKMRDNFRQSAWDRIQVHEAIQRGLDLDGDGTVDLDGQTTIVAGASLGGMMGTQVLAMSDEWDGGLLQIAGGRLSSVVTGSELFGDLVYALAPPGWTEEDVDRLMPVWQTVADGGDPMAFGRHLVRQRLVGDAEATPQLLLQYAQGDEIVNNVANRNHAQAIGLPLLGRELWPHEALEVLAGPVSGNLPGGATGGAQLFDVIRRQPDGEPEDASHVDTPMSVEARSGWQPFFQAIYDGEAAELGDPYAAGGQ
jgi:hypothetical protein